MIEDFSNKKIYDTIIVGGGPSGITAGIYATRFNLKTLLIEKLGVGGQINYTETVDNYTGFSEISSMELASNFQSHAEKLGVEILYDDVLNLNIEDKIKEVETESSGKFLAKTIIISTGARPRMLSATNAEKFIGNGISFCAICDGNFYKNKKVVVVGGGNSAVEEALMLSRIASKVSLVHILDGFQANASLVEKLKKNSNITYMLNTEVIEVVGDKKLMAIKVRDTTTKKESIIDTDGLFVSIGRIPNSEIVKDKIELDKFGYVITDEDMLTSQSGVFAVGDVRQKKIRQIITACSDGAIAGTNVANYLN